MKRSIIVAAAACLLAVGAFYITTPTTAIGPNGRMLSNLQESAARGDRRAKAYLADLERFAANNGFEIATVATTQMNESKRRGHSRLTARGIAPFWLDAFQSVDFGATYDLGSYVVERRTEALGLAGSHAHRGQLSLTGFSDLKRLCQLRDGAGATVVDAIVDVWLDETWITRFGFGPDRPDFWQRDCQELDQGVRSMLTEAYSTDPLGALVSEVRLTLYRATVDVPTSGIAHLLREDDVLLFDPEEDLVAPWSGRAATVRLAMPFDAFGELIRLQVAQGRMAEPFLPSGFENLEGGHR